MLATNIAETAITIDDIVCVINSGRLKEKSFDPYTSVSTLQVETPLGKKLCVLALLARPLLMSATLWTVGIILRSSTPDSHLTRLRNPVDLVHMPAGDVDIKGEREAAAGPGGAVSAGCLLPPVLQGAQRRAAGVSATRDQAQPPRRDVPPGAARV